MAIGSGWVGFRSKWLAFLGRARVVSFEAAETEAPPAAAQKQPEAAAAMGPAS